MPAQNVSYFCNSARTPDGWVDDALIESTGGVITRVTANTHPKSDSLRLNGPVLPGMGNVHSHAFQRAMAGVAERRSSAGDNFWVWRDAMYRLASGLDADDIEAVARLLYIDLLQGGFTSVGEFHYLHHAPDGRPYANPAELSLRILAAAEESGIRLTHLPVLYARGGFDGRPLAGAQRRFAGDVDSLLDLRARLEPVCARDPKLTLGLAFHSLRAVTPQQMALTLELLPDAGAATPIHLHIAEQTQEVEDCQRALGARPVQWLLDQFDVQPNWCLIHATHVNDAELRAVAAAQATVGLCPTTEADLGDGVFPAVEFLTAGGKTCVGTDSHVGTSAAEELRLLEYGQRLTHRQRNLLAPTHVSVGASLYLSAAVNAAQALGNQAGLIEPGRPCDLVALRGDHPLLAGRRGDLVLDTLVFANDRHLVQHVIVGGQHIVQDGQHPGEDSATRQLASRIDRIAGFW